MSESKTTIVSGGTGFIGLLTIAFIVLKICNIIDWSVWWVLSPIWIPVAFVILIVIIVSIIWLIKKKAEAKKHKARLDELKNKYSNNK